MPRTYPPYEKKYWPAMELLDEEMTDEPIQIGPRKEPEAATLPHLDRYWPEHEVLNRGGAILRQQARQRVAPTLDINKDEEQALQRGDVLEFHKSRLARGERYAATALGVVRGDTKLGRLANARLLSEVLLGSNPGRYINCLGTDGYLRKVNLDIAHAHAKAVRADRAGVAGLPSAAQIRKYHEDYFTQQGLAGSVFGGSVPLSEFFFDWCPGCDSDD
jgi:hypothetical protein